MYTSPATTSEAAGISSETRPIEYGYTVVLAGLDSAAAAERTTAALAAEGFGVLSQIDVAATLKKKLGADIRPYVILGACNPTLAQRALAADPYIGLLLPCNVVIQQRDGGAEVSIISPRAMLGAGSSPALVDIAAEAEVRIQRVMGALSATQPE